ncbi:MAG TPA: amino acid ABC transporter permease [Stellaceae bacterium]|nr:amino acid ABC transporter permease [Stellaceae bacterium]
MNYTLHYGQVIGYLPDLLIGAAISLEIAFLAFSGGMVIGLVGALARTHGGRFLSAMAKAYVIFFTNTPQLAQIYFIFFGLPDLGILLSPFQAVLLGMTLNAGAYLTEIQRAGLASVRRSELEAAQTLGMSRLQQVRYVILPHIIRMLFPPLSNQYIMVTLGTSMASVFGVEELTGRALNVNSTTFRSIEIFSLTAAIYVGMTLLASLSLTVAGHHLFRARMKTT